MAGNLLPPLLTSFFPSFSNDPLDDIDWPKFQAAVEELDREALEALEEEISRTPELAEEARKFFLEWPGEIPEQLRSLERKIGHLLSLTTMLPFKVHTGVDSLVRDIPRVQAFGAKLVVKRPEAEALVNHFAQTSDPRRVLLYGRALAGKTFLAYLVAREWIGQGGQVAWMVTSTLTELGINNLDCWPGEKPLLIWDSMEPGRLDENTFLLIMQIYGGPVLFTTRVGDHREEMKDWQTKLEALQRQYDFRAAELTGDGVQPVCRQAHVFLGEMANLGQVISSVAESMGGDLTITADGREELAERLKVAWGGRETTILGLAKAYLMALKKQGVEKVDRAAVVRLAQLDGRQLSREDEVKQVFLLTVDEPERRYLRILARLRHWTNADKFHWRILEAALQAHRNIDSQWPDRRVTLINSGIILEHDDHYTVWHDLQLNVLEIEDAVEINQRECTLEVMANILCGTLTISESSVEERADKCSIIGFFSSKIDQLGHHDTANKICQSLLPIYQEINRKYPDKFDLDLSIYYNNFGSNLARLGNNHDALIAYEQALEIRERQSIIDPATFQPRMANTLLNIGNIAASIGNKTAALISYQKALDIYIFLEKSQPDNYSSFIAHAYGNLGNLMVEMDQLAQARILYKRAFRIYYRLSKFRPRTYNPDLAMTYNDMANQLEKLGRTKGAEVFYRKALSILEPLSQEHTRAHLRNLAGIYHNFGLMLVGMLRLKEASDYLHKSLEMRTDLSRDFPMAIEPELVQTHTAVASLNMEMRDYKKASDELTEALVLQLRLVHQHQDLFIKNMSAPLKYLRNLLLREDFAARENYSYLFWDRLLKEFELASFPLCKTLGDIFLSAGFSDLALEPFLLAYLILKERAPDQAALAFADLQQAEAALGDQAPAIRVAAEAKLRPYLEAAPDATPTPDETPPPA